MTPITSHSTVAELVEQWLQQLRAERRLEGTTINEYERVLRKLAIPMLGSIRLRELTTQRINSVLVDLGTQSVNRQRKVKVVVGAMLDSAVAQCALRENPVRGSLSISRPKAPCRALAPEEVEKVRRAVQAWLNKDRPGPRSSADMVDIIELMLSTGARIGEVLAIRWRDIDWEARTVAINATIKSESGNGTFRKLVPKHRKVELSEPALVVLRRRHGSMPGNLIDAVFPTRNGTWQQVNNVERRWRQIRKDAGLEWITPELFRRSSRPRQSVP